MIRRINIFGGPGVGKSTVATDLFSTLKRDHLRVELVTEYVKSWAYEGRMPQSYDELYIFAKQLHREDTCLRQAELLITDCPVMMCCAYAMAYKFPCWLELVRIAKQWDREYPSLNFWLTRSVPYDTVGRFQNLENAEEIDRVMFQMLDEHTDGLISITLSEPNWRDAMLSKILDATRK